MKPDVRWCLTINLQTFQDKLKKEGAFAGVEDFDFHVHPTLQQLMTRKELLIPRRPENSNLPPNIRARRNRCLKFHFPGILRQRARLQDRLDPLGSAKHILGPRRHLSTYLPIPRHIRRLRRCKPWPLGKMHEDVKIVGPGQRGSGAIKVDERFGWVKDIESH